MKNLCLISLLSASLIACGGSTDDDGNEEEVITSVILTFTPTGGTAQVFEFDDPDGDGGGAPTIDPIALDAGEYTLTVGFENRLEDPAEDITEEIMDEDDEHQVFFTGSAVTGPATTNSGTAITQAYADMDGGGLPVGLDNTITAAAGTGDLTLTLRHLPPVDGTEQKVADMAAAVASGGLASIAGDTDISVTFPVTVTAP